MVGALWRIPFGVEAPGLIALAGGVVWAVLFGPLLQCLVLGIMAHSVWLIGLKRFSPWLINTSRRTRAILWLSMEVIYIASMLWGHMGMLGYFVATEVLGRLRVGA